MSMGMFLNDDLYCVNCNNKVRYKDYVTLKCNHHIHNTCIKQLMAKNQQKYPINVHRDELCFDEIEINDSPEFPNKRLMTIDYVTSHSNETFQCPGHRDLWPHENYTFYLLKNQIPVRVNYVLMMLLTSDNDDKIYHHICTKYDIVNYMNMEKQRKYFMLNDESKFAIEPIDYTVYFMIKGKEFFNHLVIKYTKKRGGRVLIYPESKCPVCLRPNNVRFKHGTLIEYLKLCSEPAAIIHKINTIEPVVNHYDNDNDHNDKLKIC